MSNRFTNNVTPLDAATLNQFEDDLKAYSNSICGGSSGGKTIYSLQLRKQWANVGIEYARPTIHILFASDKIYTPDTMTWIQLGSLIQDSTYNFGATNVIPLSIVDGNEWCILSDCRVQGSIFYVSYYYASLAMYASNVPSMQYVSSQITLDSSSVSQGKNGWIVSKIQQLPIL